jgi:ribonuclease J
MMLGEIARSTRRKLCLLGRSISRHHEVATDIGRLHWPSDLLIPPDDARAFPRDRLILLVGGTQAEPNSALRRLASGAHPAVDVEAGDSVIFSSRVIPGNDRPVIEMVCDLLRRGAIVHGRVSDPGVHTSGHAGRSEQRRLLEWLRPKAFLPLHGTLHHLLRHAELARQTGVDEVLVIENGTLADFDGDRLRHAGGFPHGKISVGLGGEPISTEALRRRAELGRSGLVIVALALNRQRELSGGPVVTSRGLAALDDDTRARELIARQVVAQLERVRDYRGIDLSDELRRAARRKIGEICGDRAVVEVQIVEVS